MIKSRLARLERNKPAPAHDFISRMTAPQVYEKLRSEPETFGAVLMDWAGALPEKRYKRWYSEFLAIYRKDTDSHHQRQPEPEHLQYVRALGFRFHAPQMPMRPLKLVCNLHEQLEKLKSF
jgi:hypothetical protein